VITRIWKHHTNTAPANGDQILHFTFADRRFWPGVRYQNLEKMIQEFGIAKIFRRLLYFGSDGRSLTSTNTVPNYRIHHFKLNQEIMSSWSIEARVALVTLFVSILVPILAFVGKIVWTRYHSRARSMSPG
jgi:hypothetical protein